MLSFEMHGRGQRTHHDINPRPPHPRQHINMYSKAESHKHGEKLPYERSVMLIKKPKPSPSGQAPNHHRSTLSCLATGSELSRATAANVS